MGVGNVIEYRNSYGQGQGRIIRINKNTVTIPSGTVLKRNVIAVK